MARLWRHVRIEDGHWIWTGFREPSGYGKCHVPAWGEQLAHRVSYIAFRGPIPDGLTVDHLCRVRACVNPDHLEPVDLRTNILRGEGLAARRARQTHCNNGHAFTPENTYVFPDGRRACRICRAVARRRHYEETGE